MSSGFGDVELRRARATEASKASFEAMRNLMVIFVMLVFLGFPGTFSKVIGGGVSTIIEYLAFGLQFILVMLATGNDVMSIKLVNLHPAYWVPYIYVVYVTADSMLVSIDRKTVIMTVLHMILTVMFALWLVEQFDMKELLSLLYSAQFVFMAITLITTVLFSKIAFYKYQGSQTFRGLFSTKNECGTQLAFGIIVQIILLRMKLQKKERVSLLFIALLAVQSVFMLLTKNMGAILITLSCVGYTIYFGSQKGKKGKKLPLGLLYIVVSIGFLFFALTILPMLESFLNSLGKDASLTGRVPLWNQTIVVMQESHTLTGYGLEMFWKTPSAVKAFHAGFRENSWAATSSASTHNMIMEMWCNLGLLGLAIFFFMILAAGKGVKYLDENQYLFCSSYMVMFTVRSLTERQTNPSTIYMLGLFIVLALMFQAQYQHRLKVRKKAKIYVEEDSKATLESGPSAGDDIFAFQKKFSNIADGTAVARPKPPPSRRRVTEEDRGEEVNRLAELLEEFDDSDE